MKIIKGSGEIKKKLIFIVQIKGSANLISDCHQDSGLVLRILIS